MNQSARLLPVLMVMLLVSVMGCGDVTIESIWRDASAAAGDTEVWSDVLQHVDHIESMIGVMNDDRAICVGLVPFKREVMAQVSGAGCIVWFNNGDDGARFGIQFPRGDLYMAERMIRHITKSETEVQLADLAECETTLELLGSDRESAGVLTCDDAMAYGISAKIREYHGRLLLAIAVPFEFTVDGTTYTIERSGDRQVALYIETPTADRRNEQDITPMGLPPEMEDDPYIGDTSRQSTQSPQEFRGLHWPINLNLVIKLAG